MEPESDDEPDAGPPVYQAPFCCACGVQVSDREDRELYTFFYEGRRIPSLWASFYRAIVRERSEPASGGEQNFHISGVDRLNYPVHHHPHNSRVFHVSWGKGDATGSSRMNEKNGKNEDRKRVVYPANFWDERNQNRYPHGFPIHAHCWTMIQRVIGQSVENELDLFLEVLYQRWKMKPRPFELGHCVKERNWYGSVYEKDKKVVIGAMWDPMDIPEVLSVIRRCSLRGSKRRSSGSQHSSACTLDLPLDILLHILDYLHVVDVEHFLVATQWQAPSSYWRSRFPRKLIFEVEELISNPTEYVDWRFLCVEVEKLLGNERLLGLQNRQRIFRILEGTKDCFYARMLN